MNSEMPRDLQSGEWLKKAEEDEWFGHEATRRDDVPPSILCFHSQQMAEKYLKAFLVYHKRWYPKIHTLDTLWELCQEIDSSFEEIKTDCVILTAFYSTSRYPADQPEFSLDQCWEAFKAGLRIKTFILGRIK